MVRATISKTGWAGLRHHLVLIVRLDLSADAEPGDAISGIPCNRIRQSSWLPAPATCFA